MELTGVRAEADAENEYTSGKLRIKSVLVMDDEESIRSLAACMLSFLGYRATTCASGEEAMEQYRNALRIGRPFHCVIMDLIVPSGMGGKDAAGQILLIDPDATLIVSSGYSDDCVMANFAAYGFRASLPKPYGVGDLGRVLASLLSENRLVPGVEAEQVLGRA
jgi:two-component system, cell cycle sensor histidine kinase and response regulator CckA